jgi:macrodomain Ter protein organizer (MatP/YcbG family)
MQWLQDTNQSIVHNLNNLIREDSSHFTNKENKYPKAKIYDLETTVRPRISETCIRASLTLRRVTTIELI